MKIQELVEIAMYADDCTLLLETIKQIEKIIDEELEYPDSAIEFKVHTYTICVGTTKTKRGYELEITISGGSGSSNYFSVPCLILELRRRYAIC